MKKILIYIFIAIVIGGIIFQSCPSLQDNSGSAVVKDPEKKVLQIPAFNRDSAFSFVDAQVAFGPRVTNSEGHRKCKAWLVDKFKSYGAVVVEQEFKATQYTGKVLNGVNIIASFNPTAPKRVIFAAHWDSRHIADQDEKDQDKPILGADDGASGVGILVELARQLKEKPTEMGIDLILFDAEDLGKDDVQTMEDMKTWCLGSQHWAANPHVPGYRAKYGVLLDMVGATGARFTKDKISMQYAGEYMDKIWRMASNQGFGAYFVSDLSGEMTDDHYFVNTIAGIPMLDIINRPTDGGFVKHWHTHNDNIQAIDKETIRVVGQLLLHVIYNENEGQL
jgi:glutaminyl-peptide cyclotransferase